MGDHVDVDVAGELDRGLADAAPAGQRAADPAAAAGAEHQLGGVGRAGEVQQRNRDVVADDGVVTAAEALDELPLRGERARVGVGEAVGPGDVDGQQRAAAGAVRDPGGATDQCLPLGPAGQGDDDPLTGLPDLVDLVLRPVALQALVDASGQPEQRQLPQGGEVSDAEVVGERRVDLLGRVDVAVGHATAQALGGHVDQLDLVGPSDDLVGDGLALRHAGDLLDDVVERLQMLHVDGREDVDPGREQLLDVLPALGVAAARDVGVGEFVDDGDLGAPGDHRVHVHLGEPSTAVGTFGADDHLDALQLGLGVGAAVALDVADHQVLASAESAVRLVEHAVGLADSRSRAEEDLQPSRR